MPADNRPDVYELRPPTGAPPAKGGLPPEQGLPQPPPAPALPGAGGFGGANNPLSGIIQMLIQQMMQQFMGRQSPSTFTPGGGGAPGTGAGVGKGPLPIFGGGIFPGEGGGPIGTMPIGGVAPPWMKHRTPVMGGGGWFGTNPVASAQGPMGNMQGPMSFLSDFMRMIQQRNTPEDATI